MKEAALPIALVVLLLYLFLKKERGTVDTLSEPDRTQNERLDSVREACEKYKDTPELQTRSKVFKRVNSKLDSRHSL